MIGFENRDPMMSEATTLPTVPKPQPCLMILPLLSNLVDSSYFFLYGAKMSWKSNKNEIWKIQAINMILNLFQSPPDCDDEGYYSPGSVQLILLSPVK